MSHLGGLVNDTDNKAVQRSGSCGPLQGAPRKMVKCTRVGLTSTTTSFAQFTHGKPRMKRRKKAKLLGVAASGSLPVSGTRSGGRNLSQPAGEADAVVSRPSASRRLTVPVVGLIALAGVAAYYNSFAGTFVHDDRGAIVENQTIRQLWPIWRALSPPCNGETVTGRPLLNLTFAVNYAMGGLNVWGYHATNLLIHIAAALLLFGILRRTFLTPLLRDRFGQAATLLALASALLWTIHPLQTESVTYIVQRAESLGGFFYLLTLYCAVRGAASSKAGFWYGAAVLACLLGMATKEVLVTAPLIVFLYDRTFLAGSFREAWRRRWGLYTGLAATWILLAYLVISTRVFFRPPEPDVPDLWSYARSQPGVILHYLRSSFWPCPLYFDCDWLVAGSLKEILPGAIVVAVLLTATAWGLKKRKAWGFVGAWFFLILAPTSSIVPLHDLAYVHRMYLSLAAVLVLAEVGGYALWNKVFPRRVAPSPRALVLRWAVPAVLWAAILLAFAYATVVRNSDYQSPVIVWQDLVMNRPNSPRAHYDLGVALADLGRTAEAITHYQQAVRLEPDSAEAHNNLGLALSNMGESAESIEHYQKALQLKPTYAKAYSNWSIALLNLGRTQEAIERWQQALQLNPNDAASHNDLGNALATVGKTEDAIAHYREALRLRSEVAEFHNSLAAALIVTGQIDEAVEHCRCAVRLKPGYAEAHYNLGTSLSRAGRIGEAIEHFQEAVRLMPNFSLARSSLARVLAHAGRSRESIEQYRQLLQQTPDSVDALCELAWLLASRGSAQGSDPVQAIQLAQRACELSPQGNARCPDALATAYAAAGRFSDAVTTAERAIQLAEAAGQTALAKNIQSRLELYRAGRPFRQALRSSEKTP